MSCLSPHESLIAGADANSIPIDVSVELTHHCNFRCRHCYIPDFLAPDLLSTERVLTLLEELAEMGTLFLTLTGGELFLRRDWLEIVQRARVLGFALRLFANGSLIDEETADQLQPLHSTVEISLYSMKEETFETITQRSGSFRRTIRGIELLRKREIAVLLKAPMMSLNHRGLGEIEAYAEEIGAEFKASPTIVAKKDGNLATLGLRASRAQLSDHYGGPGSGCASREEFADSVRDGPLCAAGNRYCSISSSGDVMACNILPGSGGNVRERPFREIWEDSAWLNRVRSIRPKDLHTCGTCARLPYCGRCHAQALAEDGDLYGPSTYARERAMILEELWSRNERTG